jgi:hypothetical protein
MGITSTQGFKFKLMASGSYGTEQLDLFKDEEIMLSDNVTGLFDLGVLPADFTRQISLPGSKKNNKFFEFVYDISVEDPYTFATNKKVECWLDFDGIYLSSGYLQLNKVNVYQNKFIDSYDVTIFGGLASFGRDLKRYFLTDLTSSLSQFNHTASLQNITSSWSGDLFSGSIVYPMAEYGQRIQYAPGVVNFGIDEPSGSLCVQDFKPAIRVKEVWDACFETFGYTYTSSFMNESWWDNVYMLCNNKLRYPIFLSGSSGGTGIDLETYGQFKIGPISGSGQTNVTMANATPLPLTWYNIQSNPGGNLSSTLTYSLDLNTQIRGNLNLNFQMSASVASGNGVPQFQLIAKNTATTTNYIIPLTNYNTYLQQVQLYNTPSTKTETFELLTQFNSPLLPSGSYQFYLQYDYLTDNNFAIALNPSNSTKSYLEITKVNQGGAGLVMDIPSNMPYGTAGIRLIDFITSIQKKYNLVIYPNKTKLNEFIVEPFNRWYKTGQIKNFNRYINLNNKIEVIPANNFAVQNLNFGDTLDGDYISQQFSKAASREFGKAYYVDQENFFSQGTFEVKTTMASSPLVYLAGTGTSGSTTLNNAGFIANASAVSEGAQSVYSNSNISISTELIVSATANAAPNSSDAQSDPLTGYTFRNVYAGNQIVFDATTQGNTINNWSFSKGVNGVITELTSGTGDGGTYTYTVTSADIAATTLVFYSNANAESI